MRASPVRPSLEFQRPPAKAVRSARTNASALKGLALALSVVATLLLWTSRARTQEAKTSSPSSGTGGTAASPARAGSETKQPIRVRVAVVNVPVSVYTRHGQPVIDLEKDDFKVYEDGHLQAIKYFYRGTRPPLRIGVILDTSNSARMQLSFEKDAASEFVFNMLPGTKSKNLIFLQTFDSTSSVVQDLTNDPEALNEKIRGLKAGGGKALYDAVYFACKEKMLKLGEPENMRRVLVLVSDGLDYHSEHSLEETISMARRAETAIYSIGNAAYGYDNPGDKVLSKLAEETGGAAYFPLEVSPGADLGSGYLSHGQIGDTSQNKGLGAETGQYSAERLIHLADSLEAISGELIEQYSLGYTPTNSAMDGTYRTIHVVAMRRGVELRSKPGYFAVPAEAH